MSSESPDVVAWPEPLKLPDDAPTAWLSLSHKYNRELAEAAMSRLRVAVKCIHELRKLEVFIGDNIESEALRILCDSDYALKVIGELPAP